MVPGYAVGPWWQGKGKGKSGGKASIQMLPARAHCSDWRHGLS
jgi:hypothetical protein